MSQSDGIGPQQAPPDAVDPPKPAEPLSPFRMMNTLFAGVGLSAAYGVVAAAIVYAVTGMPQAQLFLAAYTTSFKALTSLGLILGTALIVHRTQNVIPDTIDAAFATGAFDKAKYPEKYTFYKKRFKSPQRSVTFSAEFIVVAFMIFSYARFPLAQPAEALMVVASCAQYALGVYVGRKLCYAGMMLHSLLSVDVKRNLFKDRALDEINTQVHIVSTLTVIFVYLHVRGYHGGPFLYDSVVGESIKPFLLLPAIIATPVLLIFNFYPRAVLRRLYGKSIDIEIKSLQKTLQNEQLSEYEKRSHVMEVDRMSREELRNSLQLTLSDLPIGITILIMVLEPLIKG